MRAALDSFTARTQIPVVISSAGSLEAARRITELHDVPDLIALADEEVFTSMLMPEYLDSYIVFARNRMVIATSPRHASDNIDSTSWYRALSAARVEVGRSDPDLDPAGYRALIVLRLAERMYGQPGLERAVLARSPARNMRPKSSDLAALLETGALDFAFVYESSARAAGLHWIALPSAINLGDDSQAAAYASAEVRVTGRQRGDSLTMHGAPIRYAFAVPRGAPHPRGASMLAQFLYSADGLGAMRAAGLDVMTPRIVGSPSSPRAATAAPRVP